MKLSFFGVSAIALLVAAGPASARDIVVHAGRLIDGAGKTARTNVSILIHDDRITGVQPGFATPAGAEVIDLSKSTVLPGLIDTHVHITRQADGGNPVAEAVTTTDYDMAVESTAYARNTLLAGFTTVRDVGAKPGAVYALKKAIAKGIVEGPRMWVAGPALGPTAGHGDKANGLDPALHRDDFPDNIVDGPDDARRVVRRLRREGSDLIKIMPSGGVLSIGDDPNRQLICSICSGALLLAGLGLLNGLTATTYPTVFKELRAMGVEIIEDYHLVAHGNIATAAGCLAAIDLVGWALEKLYNEKVKQDVIASVLPVGQGQVCIY